MTQVKSNYNITSKEEGWLMKCLSNISEVNEVKDYLDKHAISIEVKPCFDSQSGWHGENVWLQDRNLSGNGYCFNGDKLLNHVRTFEKFSEIAESAEFKEHLKDREKFKEVIDFLNLGRSSFGRIK